MTGGVSLHPGKAAVAALTAASTSAFGASGVRAMTLPRAGLCTGTKSRAAGRGPAAADEVGKKFRLFRHDGLTI